MRSGSVVPVRHLFKMADSESDLTLEEVKQFMIANNGRVKNHELVTNFRKYLDHPQNKGMR